MQGDKLNALYFVSRGSVEVLRNDVVVAILGTPLCKYYLGYRLVVINIAPVTD